MPRMAGWQYVRMKREAMARRTGPWRRGGRARRRRCTSVEVKREGQREGGRSVFDEYVAEHSKEESVIFFDKVHLSNSPFRKSMYIHANGTTSQTCKSTLHSRPCQSRMQQHCIRQNE
ncbi:hypothetical protein Naga_101244g2 [Nannochloropsis gaditana]|uniref:Uncharacterized protein n=1 Tax=Nannochloropsis gaditana TaxID=72520 RepID=W7TX81_9STRA|nr:hypothetical protein Naga_101244g2 [Nannochloropsis gaditana]